jgi:hypothetical protein
MILTPRQIALGAAQAMGSGTPKTDLITITAICLCESGGNTNSYNPHATNAPAYGLFQMNEGLGSQLFDPTTSFRHMAESYHRSKWRYWGCGPDHVGGYVPFLPVATAAVVSLPPDATTTGTTAPVPCTNGAVIGYLAGLVRNNPDKYQTFHSGDPVKVKAHNIKVITLASTAAINHFGATNVACVRQGIKDFYTQDLGAATPYGFLAQLDLLTLITGKPGSVGFGGIPNPLDAFSNIASAFGAFTNLIGALFRGTTWIRIGEVVGGMILIGAAIMMISRDLGLSSVEEMQKKYPRTMSASAKLAGMTKGA